MYNNIFNELSIGNYEMAKNIDSFEKHLDNDNKNENIQNLSIKNNNEILSKKIFQEDKNKEIIKKTSENYHNLNRENDYYTFKYNKIQKGFGIKNDKNILDNFTSEIKLKDKFKNDYNMNNENTLNNNKGFNKGFNQENDFIRNGIKNRIKNNDKFKNNNFQKNINYQLKNKNYPKRDYINYKNKRNLNNNINFLEINFDKNLLLDKSEIQNNKSEKTNNDNNKLENNIRIKNLILENKKIILHIQKAFPELTEYESGYVFDLIQQKTSQTIFEIMNEISAENQIKIYEHFHQKNLKIKPFINNLYLNIYQQINLKDLIPIHKQILLYYKIYDINKKKELNLNLPDYYFYQNENERRRVLKKNEDGLYNYLPIKCLKSHQNEPYEIKEQCNFAHSENEIYFHSLIYKTKNCTKKNYCIYESFPELCFKSHNCNNDFRLIYNYLDDNVKELMFIYEKKMKKIKPYEECFKDLEIEEFNLDNFKILECQNKNILNDNCSIDRHLCLFYHNDDEKRRPQKLFKYTNEFCKDLIYENGNCSFEKCRFGNYCHYCHSKYEFYYHEKNFGKLFPCLRKKNINNECIYKKTCYGIHNNFYNEYYMKKENEMKSELNQIKNKYENIKKFVLKFSCLVCGKIPKNKIYFLIKKYHNKRELHFMCKGCKENCGKICPLCKEKINENDFIKVNLTN